MNSILGSVVPLAMFKRNFARNKTLHMRSQYCQLSAVSLFGSKIVYSWSPKYWKLGKKDSRKILKINFILKQCWAFDFLPSVPKYCPLGPGVCIPDPQQPCPPLQRFTETWKLSLGLFVCLFVWICWCDCVLVLLRSWDIVCVRVLWNPGSCCTFHLHMNYQHQIFSIHIHVAFTKCILQKAPLQRKLKRRQEAVTLRTPFRKKTWKQSSQLICVK